MSEIKKTTKGEETKNLILQNCRELFYENGYTKTTARMIAQKANINLGLLNYYFNGKLELGSSVYYEMRNSFNELIQGFNPDFDEVDMFIFSSAVELYLCLKDPHVGRFYCDITDEPSIFDKTRNFIIETFRKHSSLEENIPDFAVLAGLSITSIKPSLVKYSLEHRVDIDECILYYIKQQLHYFGASEDKSYKYLYLLKKYDISVKNDFTAVFLYI